MVCSILEKYGNHGNSVLSYAHIEAES